MIKAQNRGPFTLDGTRTFLIGRDNVAVVDPGPDEEPHIRALCMALESADEISILLTHRHRDHAASAVPLAQRTGASVFGPPSCEPPSGVGVAFEILGEGDQVGTDQGELRVLEIPGHTRDHLSFHWIDAEALFVGDLLLGRGETTWLGEYEGCIRDYLDSLEKVEDLGVSVLYPAHGPPSMSPSATVSRFRRHRMDRLEQVRRIRAAYPKAGPEELAALVYGGEIPENLMKAAKASVEVALYHLDQEEG